MSNSTSVGSHDAAAASLWFWSLVLTRFVDGWLAFQQVGILWVSALLLVAGFLAAPVLGLILTVRLTLIARSCCFVLVRCFVIGLAILLQLCLFPGWFAFGLCAWTFSCFSRSWRRDGALIARVDEGTLADGVSGQPLGSDVVDEFTHKPLTAHLCARPRRRAVWVKRLERVLGPAPPGVVGLFVRGRWTPDLPDVNYSQGVNIALDLRPDGVKILGGGSVLGKGDSRVAYLLVEERDGTVSTVFPELLAALRSYAFLRAREATLVLALRSRALEWCKVRGLSDSSASVAVESAVSWSWVESPAELRALSSIKQKPSLPWWS